MSKFKTMQDAIEWAFESQQPINEVDCPKFDMPHPTQNDLRECQSVCVNHWACHTWRHLMGSRDPKDIKEVVQFT